MGRTISGNYVGGEQVKDKATLMLAGLVTKGICEAVPWWYDTEEIGEDGHLAAMPENEKRRSQRAYDQEMKAEARRAEEAGDHHHAAWARAECSRTRKGRAARRPTNTRTRGSKRSSARRSSERSGDSGSEDGESEPPHRRLCAFCGNDIPPDRSPKATHCSDRHADRDRQRRKRQRDRARSKLPAAATTADYWRMRQLSDEDRDRLRALVDCRCNGRHLEFDPGDCFRCGHRLPRERVVA